MSEICGVCMHHCVLSPGQEGLCRARKNDNGRIVCSNYGQITSMALEPVEKKPLRMFFPGSKILSVGSFGCNLRCPFCQNYEISMVGQDRARTVYLSPETLAGKAEELKSQGNIGVAYTYNEPLVGWEYVRDTAVRVRRAGMKNVVVTNGSVSDIVMDEILPLTDAVNVDLKGFTARYYKSLGGDIETVRHFILRAHETCHVELTTLAVPGENDSREEMEELAAWAASISPDIPLHVARFFPMWKMSHREAAEVERVHALVKTARKHLRYVWSGNC